MRQTDKGQIKGMGEQIKGSVKQGVGVATGDKSLEIEGRVQKKVGQVREDVNRAVGDRKKGR